jgi:hypothetical protein
MTRAQIPDITTELSRALELIVSRRATTVEELYALWYATPCRPHQASDGLPSDLTGVLRATHSGFRDWESGWWVDDVGTRGQVIARRGTDLRMVDRIDYAAPTGSALLPSPGDMIVVAGRRDRIDPGDGWWRTAAESWVWADPPRPLVRLFYSVAVEGLPVLVERLLTELESVRDPWMLKCATAQSSYTRADAVVLFVTPAALSARADSCVDAATGDQGRPPLTFRVAPGLAMAYDPGCGESFGMNRCRLLFESDPATMDDVHAALLHNGVAPDRPWANIEDPKLPWEQ